jgi:hypothetical protein
MEGDPGMTAAGGSGSGAGWEADGGTAGSGTWIEGVLASRIGDRDLLLVFPSQAVADAWARVAPSRFGLGAVETDRFLGWDRFKEIVLSEKRTERPADRMAHTIWAAGVVARQAEKPFLARLAGPGRPAPAFVSFFADLPPALDRAASLLGGSGTRLTRDDAALADLLLLRADYADFLGRHNLFEPSWTRTRDLPERVRAVVIAPELMEDYATYRACVESLAPGVEVLRLPPQTAGMQHPPLLRFENSYEELRWTFLEIGRLLDTGVPPEDIAVTFPDLATHAPYALRAAALAGVPARTRAGAPLSASPFGRLLRGISRAAAANLDFDALRDLLLDRFAVWQDGAMAMGLVRFGVEYHAYASYRQDGKRIDVWKASFEAAGKAGHDVRGLESFYAKLKARIKEISSASSFSGLRAAILAFRKSLLDEDSWTESELATVQRSMAELEGLAHAEAELSEGEVLPDPLGLFLACLESTQYVPQGSQVGVALFPYRVSALHPARFHFVLGASQDGIKVSYAELPFLREDQKEVLGLSDSEASTDFALAYSLSGRRTSFSFAVESFTGWSVPHPFFPLEGKEAGAPPEGYAALRETCPLRAEASAWKGEAELPGRLLERQTSAWKSSADALMNRPSRYDDGDASDEVLAGLRSVIKADDGAVRLSATTLREYLACPFAWLLARGLELDDEPVGVGFFDARLAGDMAHGALQKLLGAMAALGEIEERHRDEYMKAVTAAVREVLPEFAIDEGPFLEPMFRSYAPLLEDRLRRLVEALLSEPGARAGNLEYKLRTPYPAIGAVLEGRLDRLAYLPPAKDEAGAGNAKVDTAEDKGPARAIIDYKKRHTPEKKDLLSSTRPKRKTKGKRGKDGDEDDEDSPESSPADACAVSGMAAVGSMAAAAPPVGELGDYQMAAYLALCLKNDLRVERASFWSIEGAYEQIVVGEDGYVAASDCAPEMAALEAAMERVAKGLRAGNFRPAAAETDAAACDGCAWKGVCRERYATE